VLWVLLGVAVVVPGWLAVSWLLGIPLDVSSLLSRPLAEAQRAYRQGDYAIAAGLAEARLAERPGDENAILLAARAHAHLGRFDKAEAYFVQVRLRELDDLLMRARGLVARKLLVEAAAVYDQILQEWRLNPEALQYLAVIRGSEQQRYDEALILAQQLCRIPSHQVVGHVMVAKIRFSLGHLEAAVQSFEEALGLSPDLKELPPTEPDDVLRTYAKALLLLGRGEEAERHALRARELASGAEASWILGQARQQAGDEEGAERYWIEAFARDPSFVQALQDLGQLYLRRQEPANALQWFERAHEIDPGNEAIKYCLETTHRYLGKVASRKTVDPAGTFTLSVRAAALSRGERKEVTVIIDRGKDFDQELSLKFSAPRGLKVTPGEVLVSAGEKEVQVMIESDSDAPAGELSIEVTGTPPTGRPTALRIPVEVREHANETHTTTPDNDPPPARSP
jgi:tetratricopeptide (TPR) repeat protein